MSSNVVNPAAATYHGGARIDRYEILEMLGAGGFGAVYRARHVHTHQIVALKVLRSIARTNAAAWEGLLKEARTTAALGHPNILRVLDCGVAEGGTPFLVMELAEGEDLGKLLVREGRTLTAQRAVDLAVQVLSALGAAHERGIVHRDVKPANIIVTPLRDASGTVREHARLLDFGISKMRDSEWARTQPGTSMGTPGYMAPEQFESASEADGRADVYAVAATLYQLLSGRMPIEATTDEGLLSRLMTENATPLARVAPHLPNALATVIDAGLSREPKFRWASAADFAAALQSALQTSQHSLVAIGQAPTVALDPRALASAPTSAASASQLGQAQTVSAIPSAPVTTRLPAPANAAPVAAQQSMAAPASSSPSPNWSPNASEPTPAFTPAPVANHAVPQIPPVASRRRVIFIGAAGAVVVTSLVVGAFVFGRSQAAEPAVAAPAPVAAAQPAIAPTMPAMPTYPAFPSIPTIPSLPVVPSTPPPSPDPPAHVALANGDRRVPNGTIQGPEAETISAVLATAPGVVIEEIDHIMGVSPDLVRATARSAAIAIQRCNLHVGNERTYVHVMFTMSGPMVQPGRSSLMGDSAFDCVGPAIRASLPAVPPMMGMFTLRVRPAGR